jgi:hypothetical protein
MLVNFTYNEYDVTARVESCSDAYGTGDSPTSYEVDLLTIMSIEGVDEDPNDLGKFFYESLVDEAINVYKEM